MRTKRLILAIFLLFVIFLHASTSFKCFFNHLNLGILESLLLVLILLTLLLDLIIHFHLFFFIITLLEGLSYHLHICRLIPLLFVISLLHFRSAFVVSALDSTLNSWLHCCCLSSPCITPILKRFNITINLHFIIQTSVNFLAIFFSKISI